mmetsp:Transcript_21741/g.35669  ORF Transcript_21741/g.35669 Transcript_21741/m.35669 type:complete len:145 (-) Transcript_21741:820-1254(-)
MSITMSMRKPRSDWVLKLRKGRVQMAIGHDFGVRDQDAAAKTFLIESNLICVGVSPPNRTLLIRLTTTLGREGRGGGGGGGSRGGGSWRLRHDNSSVKFSGGRMDCYYSLTVNQTCRDLLRERKFITDNCQALLYTPHIVPISL